MPVLDPRTETQAGVLLGAVGSISEEEVKSQALGAYLGLAVGDALGVTLEFLTPREIRERHGEHGDIIGGGWLRVRRGQVTDDTQMSLALGSSILTEGEVRPRAVAEAFDAWMRSKPIDIGHTVRRGISRFRRTGKTAVPRSEFDAGNGACMRCLPVALAYLGADESALAEANRRQSHVTHNSELADLGTLTVLRMVQAALLGAGRHELQQLADELVAADKRYRYDRRRMENPSGFIVETLVAVFQSLFTMDSFEGALVDVVNRGGDADTTGAILGMIAGALYGLDEIPGRWLNALERKTRQRCRNQAQQLLRMSPWGSQAFS
jgi:ADP-ribosyl-[dinitrogen reductase] hydrolase